MDDETGMEVDAGDVHVRVSTRVLIVIASIVSGIISGGISAIGHSEVETLIEKLEKQCEVKS